MKKNFQNLEHIQNLNPSQNIFYRAVVENNDDGGVAKKCQVRVLGVHSEVAVRSGKNIGVPTKDLPWAELMGAADGGGGMSGFGPTAVPLKGTWVWVFFDGGDWNKPVIAGVINGVSTKTADSKGKVGFEDPTGEYPRKDRLGGDASPSSSGKTEGTGIETVKSANRDAGVPMAKGAWGEDPENTSSAKYPLNNTYETPSGNIIENDDTGSDGRMHWFHHSGTYWEIVGSGKYTLKVVDDFTQIVDGDYQRLIKGDEHQTIYGESTYKVDSDEFRAIGGSKEETVKGSVTEDYSSGLTTNGGPSITLKAGIINLN